MDAKAIPGYLLKKKLGEGAMATVYLAKEAKLDRYVALKVMAPKFLSDATFADRFLREARIVASISHRNIVTVFDVGSHGDYHYLAMELLPGGDLTKKLKKGLTLEDAISHVKDIAEGLQYASSKNFIHRDIKPDNVMFGEDGRAVITDFGIARNTASETNMTMVGSVIGTPHYMSPEQARAEKLDHRTDLYSLGIILYEILTGSPPFKGDSAIAVGVMHITQPIPLLPDDFADFQDFIDIALAKHPDDRFQSGDEFIEALSNIGLEEHDGYDDSTRVLSQEDIADALETADFSYTTGAGHSSVNTGIKKRSKLLPITFSFIFLIVFALIGHFYFVNLLGQKLTFTLISNNVSKDVAIKLSDLSQQLATHSANLQTQIFPQKAQAPTLSFEQEILLRSYNTAIKQGKLFSPRKDCAEHYLKELRKLDSAGEFSQAKSKELLILAIRKSSQLLNENKAEDAYKLITSSKRILKYVDDKKLKLEHKQLTSSIIIAR